MCARQQASQTSDSGPVFSQMVSPLGFGSSSLARSLPLSSGPKYFPLNPLRCLIGVAIRYRGQLGTRQEQTGRNHHICLLKTYTIEKAKKNPFGIHNEISFLTFFLSACFALHQSHAVFLAILKLTCCCKVHDFITPSPHSLFFRGVGDWG